MSTPLTLVRRARAAVERVQREAEEVRLPAQNIPLPLSSFGPRFFPHFLTAPPPQSLFHHDLITDLNTMTQGERRCYIAPRGSAKSTWATLINVLKRALDGLEHYIIIISDIQPNANKFLKAIKDEVETNEELRAAYRHCRAGPVWREEAIELPNGVRIEALGKGGKIRGRRHRQYRPTLIILDDPQSFDDAYSPTQLEKDFQWLMSDVMKAGGPETNFVVLGTALADTCIVCRLEKTPGWKFKRFKQLISEPTHLHLWQQWRDILFNHGDPARDDTAQRWYAERRAGEEGMDAGATVLWPSRVPLVEIMKARYSEGERAFQCEQQGVPMPPGDAEWPIEYFDWPGFWFDEWPTDVTLSAMALDPSKGKESKQGDYQALIRAVRDRAGIVWIEAWLEKMDSQALSAFLVDRFYEFRTEAVALEENGFQELMRVPIEQAVKARDATLKLPLVSLINTVKKEVRIRRLTPYLAQKTFRFKNTAKTRLLVDQLKKFPFDEHDDGPDALEMALRVLVQLSHAKNR